MKPFNYFFCFIILIYSSKLLSAQQTNNQEKPKISVRLDGKTLFNKKCSPCHNTNDKKLIGPGLAGATSRHSKKWLINFTCNSIDMISKGDTAAQQVYFEYAELVHPKFEYLSNNEIWSIFNYLDDINKVSPPSPPGNE